MELEEIKTLPVKEHAEKDCILFLWVTLQMIPEALQVIRAWGFAYKTTAFVWVKLARRTSPGCEVWGNEVVSDIVLDSESGGN